MPGPAADPGQVFMPMDRCRGPAVDPCLAAVTPRAQLPDHLRLYLETQRKIKRGELKVPLLAPPPARLERRGVRPAVRSFKAARAAGSAYDASLAVGQDHVLVAVNFAVAAYAKSDGRPVFTCGLRDWFPNVSEDATFVFDPRTLYDQYTGRWILLALAWPKHEYPPSASWLLLSVSSGADPLGPWVSWVFDVKIDGRAADYPCLGVDERGIYVTFIAKTVTRGRPDSTRLRVFSKETLNAGQVPTFVDFTDLENPDGTVALRVQPCHAWGANSATYLANTLIVQGQASALTLWELKRASSHLTLTCQSVRVDPPYSPPIEAPQKDEMVLGTIGGSSVRSAVCRDGAVWLSFAMSYGDGKGLILDAVRWLRIPVSQGPVTQDRLMQEGMYYCYPSAVPNRLGNVTMVASRSWKDGYPSLDYAVWTPDGSNTTGVVAEGKGPHLRCRLCRPCDPKRPTNGWGDYNAAALDPTDETTVWLYGGAGAKDDKSTWDTRIAAVS